MTRPDVRLIRSPLSIVGMALTTISATVFIVVFLADLFGLHTNPYLGILFFLVLPALFLVGLVLIPLGGWLERRRVAARRAQRELWPRIDLNDPVQRRTAVIIFALTIANIIIVSLAAYRGVVYMDTTTFCGQVCHTVMKPEFVAHQDRPHAQVSCVECHIGPGAAGFARSKLSGARQVFAVVMHTYSRPIPVPVRTLRPARDVCEQCHWPERYYGDVIRRVVEYAEDEANTESVTTLTVHVGGGSERLGLASGIHWHMNVANEIEYVATDDKRQTIPYVRLKDRFGKVREYFAEGAKPEDIARGERRRMDCMDCHNRASHPISPTPERAVNEVMARGDISKTLPYVRREAVKTLKASYASQAEAAGAIDKALRDFYQRTYPQVYASRRADVDRAIGAVQGIYNRNVFPEMRVEFGTYPSDIGHVDSPGCFRCHDDSHKTKDGKAIGQDCETCHHIE